MLPDAVPYQLVAFLFCKCFLFKFLKMVYLNNSQHNFLWDIFPKKSLVTFHVPFILVGGHIINFLCTQEVNKPPFLDVILGRISL